MDRLFPPFRASAITLLLLSNLFLAAAQENIWNITGPSMNDLNATYLDPPLPGRLPIQRWVALGDSFSAGPGAGCQIKGSPNNCKRNDGAYAPQMQASETFKNSYKNPDWLFQACTGDTILPVVNQLDFKFVNDQVGIVMLSVGGNDILFSRILKSCVLWNGECAQRLTDGRNILYGDDLFKDYIRLTSIIMGYTQWQSRTLDSVPAKKTLLYATGYPPFFDTWTGQCNDTTFLPGGLIGPKMTQQRRQDLNMLGQELNFAIAYWLDLVNLVFASSDSASYVDYAKYVDQDRRYNSHRFCREGVTEPDRKTKDTWFFHLLSKAECNSNAYSSTELSSVSGSKLLNGADAKTCMTDELLDSDDMTEFSQCLTAILAENGTTAQETIDWPDVNDASVPPEWAAKTFHPKTAGFAATKDEIIEKLNYQVVQKGQGELPSRLRIMAIGDDITVGASNNYDSYRRHLWNALDPGIPELRGGPWVLFVGDKLQGNDPQLWTRHQAIADDATVSNIHSSLNADRVRFWAPNVVIIMAGSVDVRAAANSTVQAIQPAINEIESMIWDVQNWCYGCAILVAQLPPQGEVPSYGNWSAAWPPTTEQKKVITFNTLLAELMTRLQTQSKLHVMKVHTSATLFHQNADGSLKDVGFNRIAMNFAEAVSDAFGLGWISRPFSKSLNGTEAGSTATNEGGGKTLPHRPTGTESFSFTTSPASSTASATPTPTSKLAIAYKETYDTDLALAAGQWNFYAEPLTASSFDVCKPATTASIDSKADATIKAADPTVIASVPFPSGDFTVGTLGTEHAESGCTFHGDGKGPGTLDCGDGAVKGFDCKEAADLPDAAVSASKLTKNECGSASNQNTFAFKVLCTW